MSVMRTTLSIDDRLLQRAKRHAAAQGVTLSRYVEVALQAQLSCTGRSRHPVELPVFTGTGLRPGISPSSNRALSEALDASRGRSTPDTRTDVS